MRIPRRQFLHLMAGAAGLPALSHFAWAQAYPTRPITMIVPFPAGGATDVIARIMVERMRGPLGQPISLRTSAELTEASASVTLPARSRMATRFVSVSTERLYTTARSTRFPTTC